MRKWFQDNVISLLSLSGIVAGALYLGEAKEKIFTTVEGRVETESFIEDVDPAKIYGEYIIDSIEEVETQKWRSQQMIHDSIQDAKFEVIDSLLRLNIRINYETKKKLEE